ncbi:hypothetical protein [Novosphingobium resinovorum]|uniref:Uncharacterized protein n=1 Tax=Novosphingobium resinovorum TaxID=158500 RepID=A0A1D8A533_9SPHN|nr:hypothetical protein [Novosphingobium resinovorum]AOR77223.1 hypothetical protein BES08_11020 [Novosphingobium resinovorum]
MQQRQSNPLNQSSQPVRREQVTPGPVRAASVKQVNALSERVDAAEASITALDSRADALEAGVVALDGRLDTAEADIDALQAAMVAAHDGHLTLSVRAVTANTAVNATDYLILVDATAGNVTVTMPAPQNGRQLCVKRIDASANTVSIAAAANIDGAASKAITPQYASLTVMCDGATWWIV